LTDPLSHDAVAAGDPGGMLGDVLAQPLQVGDALWRAESAGIPKRDMPGGLLVCGMGGSAIGGDLAAAALGDRATRPIRTVRGYEIESWTLPDTLVLCASYSGDTEETLACFEAAGAAGAQRVAITTGGQLAEAARAEGVPVIGIPSGMMPRAAVLYVAIATLECAALCGAAPGLHAEIDTATGLLERLAQEYGPNAAPDSQAKALAHALKGTVPVIHGAGPTTAVARRWHTQVNENADGAAFFAELPEAAHNEICGWQRGRSLAPLAAVFLFDPDQHPRVAESMELTAQEAERAGAPTLRVTSRGDSRLERVLSLVFLGDLTSVYLGLLEGVDPTPIAAIDRLKSSLVKP
jgi:glucose/mannose-6-phosphate isomerase